MYLLLLVYGEDDVTSGSRDGGIYSGRYFAKTLLPVEGAGELYDNAISGSRDSVLPVLRYRDLVDDKAEYGDAISGSRADVTYSGRYLANTLLPVMLVLPGVLGSGWKRDLVSLSSNSPRVGLVGADDSRDVIILLAYDDTASILLLDKPPKFATGSDVMSPLSGDW